MAQWKLGYPQGLDTVSSESEGRALYGMWSVQPIALSNKEPRRTGGQIDITESTYVKDDNAGFEADEYNGGFLKLLSGDGEGEVSKVTETKTTGEIYCDAQSKGAYPDDWYEITRSEATYTFPVYRSPQRKDYKRVYKGDYNRFPYYEDGVNIPQGFEPDNFVLRCIFTNWAEWRKFENLLNVKVTYDGLDADYEANELAPLILEEGEHTADNQYLVNVMDYRLVRAGENGQIIEVDVDLQNTAMASYRGI